MLLRRIVRATTEQEIDSALAWSADQVIVEGDDRLLSYAVAKASKNPEHEIDIQIEKKIEGRGFAEPPSIFDDEPRTQRPEQPHPSASSASASSISIRRRRSLVIPLFITGVIAVLIVMAVSIVQNSGRDVILEDPKGKPETGPVIAPSPDSGRDVISLVQTLVWPTIVLAAIIALFLIARQAIGSGRNVEVNWKVTEQITGRVVISKVRTRTAAKQSGAG
jgi:hypothetical protein